MNKRQSILSLLLLCVANTTLLAQFSLPSMDVQLKGGVAFMTMGDANKNNYDYLSPQLTGELNLNISQYFAIGGFYTRGFSGNVNMLSDNGASNNYGAAHQLYGAKLRISTGRQPRFRPFAEFSYGNFEMYIEKENYRISSSSPVWGIAIGLMTRLNGKFYAVFPQFSIRNRNQQFYFETPGDHLTGQYSPIGEVSGGLIYHFGKKK